MGRAFGFLFMAFTIVSGCAPNSDTKTIHAEPDTADADSEPGTVFLANAELEIREQEILDGLIVDGRIFDEYIVLPTWIDGQALAGSEFSPDQGIYSEKYMSNNETIRNWNEVLEVFMYPKRLDRQNPLLTFTALHASKFNAVCLSSAQRSHGNSANNIFPVTTKVFQCETKPGLRGFNDEEELILRHEAVAFKVIVAVKYIYVIQTAWHTSEPNPKLPLSADGSIGDSALYDRITAGVEDAKVCVVSRDEADTAIRKMPDGR